jgi:hypothetical protein
MHEPNRDNLDYKYGIFAKIRNSGSRGWNNDTIRDWCDKNDVHYKLTDTREQLVRRIKQAGYK